MTGRPDRRCAQARGKMVQHTNAQLLPACARIAVVGKPSSRQGLVTTWQPGGMMHEAAAGRDNAPAQRQTNIVGGQGRGGQVLRCALRDI